MSTEDLHTSHRNPSEEAAHHELHQHEEGEHFPLADESEALAEEALFAEAALEDVSLESVLQSAATGAGKEAVKSERPAPPSSKECIALVAAVAELKEPAEKLKLILDFMKSALSEGETPNFRNFWESRRLCLPLFKENIVPAVRTSLWNTYRELSEEARRIKAVLDEQSAFAMEQIDMAVQALETDLSDLSALLAKATPFGFPVPCYTLEKRMELYSSVQGQLNLLATLANRITGMRKGLVTTDMRIRHKNKLFKRLSALGDLVFPRRKELMRQVSETFLEDIAAFSASFANKEDLSLRLSDCREEVKALQLCAKSLSLTTKGFNQSRAKLSTCWEALKELDKERRNARNAMRQASLENVKPLQEKIDLVKTKFESKEFSADQAYRELGYINSSMRKVELGRDEVRLLKGSIADVQALLDAEAHKALEAKEKIQREREQAQAARLNHLREAYQAATAAIETSTPEELTARRESLLKDVVDAKPSRTEKVEFDRLHKAFRDAITAKQEQALLNLPDDAKAALASLRQVLQERTKRRDEIRDSLEQLRKAGGNCGLDFEAAMLHSQSVTTERERLEVANAGILEIEQKIKSLR